MSAQEHRAKYAAVKACPSCGGEQHPEDKHGWLKSIRCKHEFHLWYCSNNYTRYGCAGHQPGSVRCMDLG